MYDKFCQKNTSGGKYEKLLKKLWQVFGKSMKNSLEEVWQAGRQNCEKSPERCLRNFLG